MNDITAILHQLEEGRLSTEEAAEKIRAATAPASSHTDIDYGRLERTGCPEVIYGAGKTPDQIEEIARGLLAAGQNVLATRLNVEALDYLNRAFPEADMHPEARLMRIILRPAPQTEGFIGIVRIAAFIKTRSVFKRNHFRFFVSLDKLFKRAVLHG